MNYNDFLGNSFDPKTNEFNPEMARKQAYEKRGKTNILLVGATGVGKSSLINAVFGDDVAAAGTGKPITQYLTKYTIKEKGLTLWDTKGIEAKDFEGTKEQLVVEIERAFQSLDDSQAPHIAWLCIKEPSKRIEDRELDILELLRSKGIPTIVVFTNTQFEDGEEFYAIAQKIIDEQYRSFIQGRYVRVNSTEYKFMGTLVPKSGLDELIEMSIEAFPEGAKNARQNFLKIQQVKIAERFKAMQEGASKIVHIAAASAGTVGASPIPGSDAPLIAAIQSTMIYKLNTEFEVNEAESSMTTLLTGILSATALAQVGKAVVANVLKFIPGAGTIFGAVISATTAVAITEAVGFAYIKVLESYFNHEKGQVELPENTEEILKVFKSTFESMYK